METPHPRGRSVPARREQRTQPPQETWPEWTDAYIWELNEGSGEPPDESIWNLGPEADPIEIESLREKAARNPQRDVTRAEARKCGLLIAGLACRYTDWLEEPVEVV